MTSMLKRLSNSIVALSTALFFCGTTILNAEVLVIDEFKEPLCNPPTQCCIGGSCPISAGCSLVNGTGELKAQVSPGSPSVQALSVAAPCSIIGSYRDTLLNINNTGSAFYSTAKVAAQNCSSGTRNTFQFTESSTTKSTASIIWNYGAVPANAADVQLGLNSSNVVNWLGTEIILGTGAFVVPYCHRNPNASEKMEIRLSIYTHSGVVRSYVKQLSGECAGATSSCPTLEEWKVEIPAELMNQKLGAVKLEVEGKGGAQITIGRVVHLCTTDAASTSNPVFSCPSVPACTVPTPTPSPTPTPPTTCTETDVKPTLLAIDSNADRVKKTINSATKLAEKNKALTSSVAKKYRSQALNLYNKVWNGVWTIPVKIKNCTGGVACTTVSFESTIAQYEKDFAALKTLADKIGRSLNKSRVKAVKSRGKQLLNVSAAASAEASAQSSTLPRKVLVCG